MENPIMTLTMEDGGKIVAELYPEKAPQSVRNFISLANKGFYDGLIFHRVISGFMIQGGCPQGTGMGGPGYCIKGEFKLNGVKNNLSHKRGVLSMARAQSPNSAGSQFFIMHEDGEFLDGQYAAFGKVLEGMDVVDKIAAVKTDGNDRPMTEQKIATIRVDTKGEEYPEPDKLRDPYGRFSFIVLSVILRRTNRFVFVSYFHTEPIMVLCVAKPRTKPITNPMGLHWFRRGQ